MIRAAGISSVLLALLAGGCDTSQTPCTESCPDLAGVYSIEDTLPVGNCGFSPYLLAPSVDIQQGPPGSQVVLSIIDPTTQLEVPLTGDVYGPGAGEGGLLGSFRIDSRTTRLASRTSDKLVTLHVTATGSVSLVAGRRVLSATLSTTDVRGGQGCTATLSVTGAGR